MMIASIVFLFVPAMMLFGYQSVLETKGINDPTLAISLYKTSILLDIATKIFLFCLIDDLDTFLLLSMISIFVFFFWFYVRLSLSIPKKSLRGFRKFPQETNYTMCAFKVAGWCILSTVFNLFIVLMGWNYEDPVGIYMLCFIMTLFLIAYTIFAAKSLVRLDRLKYPSIRSLHAMSQNNSPIILLRSFKIDSNPTISGKVFDETICENLDLDQNPIVSLANPDEILPSGGSLKIQAKDSEWKEVVKEALRSCRAVILVEGLSEGLHWEISKLKEYLNYKQLFVLVPSRTYRELAWCYNDDAGTGLYSMMRNVHRFMSKITFSGRKDRKQILNTVWTDFSSELQQYGIKTPKDFPGDDSLLCFDEKWNGTKQNGLHKTDQMLNFIVTQTKTFNKPDFDYPQLGEKIASFEVNGFLSKGDLAPFQNLVDRCNKIGRIVALIVFLLFIVGIFFI